MSEQDMYKPDDYKLYQAALEALHSDTDPELFMYLHFIAINMALKYMVSLHKPHHDNCPCTNCT